MFKFGKSKFKYSTRYNQQMLIQKYRLHIVIIFISIFTAKMFISAAPVFIGQLDKDLITSVILQLEHEHAPEAETSKDKLKFMEYKPLDPYHASHFIPPLHDFDLSNAFFDHFKRYITSYYPAVPTPPPNFC